jgi:hypothetical protein
MESALALQLSEPGSDAERLDELATQLREELLALDVDDVERVSAGAAPPDTRAIDLALIGALLVTAKQSTDVVAHVVDTVRAWLKRSPEPTRTVHITLGDHSIELSAASSAQQDELVAAFIRASRGTKDGR